MDKKEENKKYWKYAKERDKNKDIIASKALDNLIALNKYEKGNNVLKKKEKSRRKKTIRYGSGI